MNQHSQGGGSIQDGSIELMQNRRLLHDDYKGVDENLDETQPDGRGIAVNTKYFVTFADLTSQNSAQRATQLRTDEPLQFFYASDFTQNKLSATFETNSHSAMHSQLTQFDGDLKLLSFPEARNQVILRLENLADLFDGAPSATPMFDVHAYALALFKSANSGAAPANMEITERTLSNNQDFATMQANKFKWTSADPAESRLAQDYPKDDGDSIALQPQRIRVFRVVYTPASTDEVILQ